MAISPSIAIFFRNCTPTESPCPDCPAFLGGQIPSSPDEAPASQDDPCHACAGKSTRNTAGDAQ